MDKIIFFAILSLFPFGQLFKIGFINLFDVLVLILAVITVLKKPIYPSWYRYFIYFVMSCMFGLFLNSSFVNLNSILYLVRLISYSLIAVYVSNYFLNRKSLILNLLSVAVATTIFGWLQYLLWPDLTSLKYLGWDDHLLRMVGTFLDPTYLGLILVLGIVLAYEKFPKVMYFLLFSLAFTYSRASYLVAGLFLLFKKQNIALIFFILIVLFLPKNIGEGTTLTRTVSGNSKLINYAETLQIIKKSPLFGVGFNNICSARRLYLSDLNIDSHACNGADSSILFLLATTGIVGLVLFISFVLRVMSSFDSTFNILYSSFFAVLIHSTFANSLFYPHIMFWLFVLIGLQTEVSRQTS